jgi:hypothetical protein
MIFILMIEFTGCYSTKIISTSDLASSNMYMIHCKNVAYSVYEVEIADSLLTGIVDLNKKYKDSGYKTHIYLSVDSVLKFDNDHFSLPVKYITSIEQKIPDARKTKTLTAVLIVAGCVGLGVGLIALIGMAMGAAANSVVNTLNASDGCKIM